MPNDAVTKKNNLQNELTITVNENEQYIIASL